MVGLWLVASNALRINDAGCFEPVNNLLANWAGWSGVKRASVKIPLGMDIIAIRSSHFAGGVVGPGILSVTEIVGAPIEFCDDRLSLGSGFKCSGVGYHIIGWLGCWLIRV